MNNQSKNVPLGGAAPRDTSSIGTIDEYVKLLEDDPNNAQLYLRVAWEGERSVLLEKIWWRFGKRW